MSDTRWNYRVVRSKDGDLNICTVYRRDGMLLGGSPASLASEDIGDLYDTYNLMGQAFSRRVVFGTAEYDRLRIEEDQPHAMPLNHPEKALKALPPSKYT